VQRCAHVLTSPSPPPTLCPPGPWRQSPFCVYVCVCWVAVVGPLTTCCKCSHPTATPRGSSWRRRTLGRWCCTCAAPTPHPSTALAYPWTAGGRRGSHRMDVAVVGQAPLYKVGAPFPKLLLFCDRSLGRPLVSGLQNRAHSPLMRLACASYIDCIAPAKRRWDGGPAQGEPMRVSTWILKSTLAWAGLRGGRRPFGCCSGGFVNPGLHG